MSLICLAQHVPRASQECLVTERGLRLTFSTGDAEESDRVERGGCRSDSPDPSGCGGRSFRSQLTLTVLGHQVVRTAEAYGLLLRTEEFGDVVFSLPQPILER